MNALSDPQLLRAYSESRSEAAFAELVRRHIDFVHSAAFRMVNDLHLAKDVTQGVFVALAKDAGKLTRHPVLSGWLHRTARNIAAQTVRTEVRRRNREKEAAAMNESLESDASWEEIAPHLDAALAELSEPDRDAVLLRYFENKPAQEMATLLGISAEAAQKRVSRAVERLRENFAKRGVTAGAAGLAGVISSNAVQAAPAGLAVAVSATAHAGAVGSTAITVKSLFAAALILLAGAGIYHFTLAAGSSLGMSTSLPAPLMTQKSRPAEGDSLIEKMFSRRSETARVDRKKELESLKEKWIGQSKRLIQPGVLNLNEEMAEERALREESAKLLLCGQEAIELMSFLEDRKIYNGVQYAVADVFASPSANEARILLVGIPDTRIWIDLRTYQSGGTSYREAWSKAAGRTCPDDEFDAFREALNSSSCAQEALFGRNERLFSTDPVGALTSTLEALATNTPSDSRTDCILHLFEQNFPANVDFEALEKLLPVGDGEPWRFLADAFNKGREQLFKKWAQTDPAAAANHLLENPERCAPSLIQAITEAMSDACHFGDPSSPGYALSMRKWVEQFPDGPYYDEAAAKVVLYLAMNNPVEARELASRITDLKRKESALQEVEFHQKVKRGEASYEDGH